MSEQELEVSVVMPCLDEAETVSTCVRKALDCMRSSGIAGEVIVADNGSQDGSPELAISAGARVVRVPVRGYGSALHAGIDAACGRYVIMGDADDSYDFSALLPFVEELRQGFDLVMGNRFKGGIAPGAMPPLHRYLGNPILSFLGRLLFRSSIGDFHCGLRGFRRESAKRMNLVTTGMEFASEMVVKAELLGMRITEVPTTLEPDGRSRAPHLRSWRDGWRHVRFLLCFSPRWLFLYPGAALIVCGLATGIWLAPGPQKVGNVAFDVHTLVFASTAVLLGVHSILFATHTRVFAMRAGFLPPQRRLRRALRFLTLEKGLAAGGLLILIGLGGALWSVYVWSTRSFGALDPLANLRTVIPSALSLALGTQIVLSSFFLSILQIPGPPLEAGEEEASGPRAS